MSSFFLGTGPGASWVTKPKLSKVAPLPKGASQESLIVECLPSPPYKGQENPVFTFDSASLFSRAPSRVSELSPTTDIPFRTLPPTRRGSYFPFLPSEDRNSLAVPGGGVGVHRSSKFAAIPEVDHLDASSQHPVI